MSEDTPGIPADQVPVPRIDLKDCSIRIEAPGLITIRARDYAGAGRIFKWLQGQLMIANRKIHG